MSAKEGTGSRRDRLPRQVWILSGVSLLIAIGFGVMSPVLPIYARTFGVSSFLIGLVVSSMSILRLITMPASSRLMRYVGPRELAIAGNILIAITTFMIGISNSFWGIMLWRGLSGFGSALYGVSSMALLFASVPAQVRGRASSIYGGGFVLGGMAGPALGGLIFAVSMRAPFFFYALTLAFSAVVLLVFLPRTPASQREELRQSTITLRDLVKDSRFRAVLVVHFGTGWQSFGVRAMLIPLFIVEGLRMSTSWVGVAFTAAAIVQSACIPLTGWGTDRLGRRFMIIAGGTTTALASIGFALTGSYVMLVVLMCLYSAGVSTTLSASQAMLADTVPISASSGLAAYQMSADIGLIIGPLVAGFTLDVLGLSWAWIFGAVIILAGVGMAWVTPAKIQPMIRSRDMEEFEGDADGALI